MFVFGIAVCMKLASLVSHVQITISNAMNYTLTMTASGAGRTDIRFNYTSTNETDSIQK